jgi:DNA-binding Lrp family transcriptional regulator
MESFETALRKVQGVREATVLTGAFDARLRVDCADPAHLGFLIEELRTRTGVQETSSTVICRSLNI